MNVDVSSRAVPARRPRLFMALLPLLAALMAAPGAAVAADKAPAKGKAAGSAKAVGDKTGGDKAAKGQNPEKPNKPRKLTPGEKFLREAAVKLENFTFGAADLAAAGRHARQAKALTERLPFDLVAARYQREYQDRPDRAAAEVLPHLFDKDTVAAWEKATAQLRKEAPKPGAAKAGKTAKGKDAAADAAPGAAAPLAPLPPAGEWKLTADNAPAAVEAAACLAAAGQMAEALSVIDRVGADFADANRVCAAELAGDLNVRNATYSRAIEFYQNEIATFSDYHKAMFKGNHMEIIRKIATILALLLSHGIGDVGATELFDANAYYEKIDYYASVKYQSGEEIQVLIDKCNKPEEKTASFGKRVEDARERLFRARRRKRSQRCLAAHALKVARAIKGARASRPGMANLKKRFKEHAAGYLRFLSERIELTNTVAERALRHCVIDRKVTQGTRGETGERWCERAWAVVATCRSRAGRPSSSSSMPRGLYQRHPSALVAEKSVNGYPFS